MSTSEAVAVLKKQIEAALSEYTRGDLDILVHVIDISYNSLLASNKRRNTNKYALDYKEFLNTVRENSNKVSDYLEALTLVKNNKGTCLLEEEGSILLINKNFNTARDFITRISRLIKHNDSFGVSFRSRNLQEIETSRKYGKAKGSFFLRKNDNGYGVYKVDKLPETNTYGMIPVEGYQDVKSINYLAQVRSKQYSKSTNLSRFVDLEVEFNEAGEVVEKKSLYSVLDLGHGQGREEVQATPLGKKISNILELGISEKGRKLLNRYMDELVRLHNVIDFKFKNTSTDKEASGYVVISVQHYERNNNLSKEEGKILRNIAKNIEKLLPNIPGSNTILQDGIEIVENKIVAALTGKPIKKILKHNNAATGSVSGKTKIPKPDTSTSKVQRNTVTVSAVPKIPQKDPQLDLLSLTNFINKHLQDVVSANMGDGSARNILNYRTGRFASSVKVEKMSQSREGMITAFYTYMKNPYATFSEGGQQEYPKTRDPKLLISKSIREIAAEKVSNRLKAVVV